MKSFLSGRAGVIAVVAIAAIIAGGALWVLGSSAQDRDSASLGDLEPGSDPSANNGNAATAPGATPPRPPGAPGAPGSPATAPDTGAGTGAPGGPSSSAITPAADGEQLVRLTSPPDRSVWALSPDSYDEGVSLDLTFAPYGIGPDSLGPSIVARVFSAEPTSSGGRVPELDGRNVVLVLGRTEVPTGGRYVATARTEARGDRIVIVLHEVTKQGAGTE